MAGIRSSILRTVLCASFCAITFICSVWCGPLLAENLVDLKNSELAVKIAEDGSPENLSVQVQYHPKGLGKTSGEFFRLSSPPRLVIDVKGLNKLMTRKLKNLSTAVREVRLGHDTKNQRIVLELDPKYSFRVSNVDMGDGSLTASLSIMNSFGTLSNKKVTPQIEVVSQTTDLKKNSTQNAEEAKPQEKPAPLNLNEYLSLSSPKVSEQESSPIVSYPKIRPEIQREKPQREKTKPQEIQIPKEVSEPLPVKGETTETEEPLPEEALEPITEKSPVSVVQQEPLTFKAVETESWLTPIPDDLGNPLWVLVSISGTFALLVFLLHLLIKSTTRIEIDKEQPAATNILTTDETLPTLQEAYRVLGCDKESPNLLVKERYRRLVKVFHYDALQPKDLAPEIIDLSRKEFEKVKAAYTRLKIERPQL